jgi:hypothetical protein
MCYSNCHAENYHGDCGNHAAMGKPGAHCYEPKCSECGKEVENEGMCDECRRIEELMDMTSKRVCRSCRN